MSKSYLVERIIYESTQINKLRIWLTEQMRTTHAIIAGATCWGQE